MKKIIRYFIPDTIPKDADSQRKAQLTVATLLIIIYFNINYIVISALIEFPGGILSQLPLLIAGVITIMLYKFRVTPKVLYPFYFTCCTICIAVTVYYTGGFMSVLFPWLASTPIVALMVWSKSGGRFSIVFVLLAEVVFYYFYNDGYGFPNQIKPAYQNIFYLTCNLGLVLILFWIALVFENAKTAALNSLSLAMQELGREKERSEELLLNILPAQIAEELKAKGSAEAKLIDEVTVIFTDFKGFTMLSEKFSPQQLVSEINECYSAFDGIMQKYGVEKIKTIGDAYMAVGGLPTPNKTHASDTVKAALEIQQFMNNLKARKEAAGQIAFDIRIGIHTGPVVAGIVGVKKFQYDIWGDTVNTASRMESSGETGKINISGPVWEKVKNEFRCVHRGKIDAKGKGEIDMYFVEGPL
jgi:class 3 adenylate cyclase